MFGRFIVVLILSWPGLGQKKAMTLGRPALRRVGVAVWAPDGQSFVHTLRGKLWLLEAEDGSRRELGSLEALEKAAAKRRTQEPHRWENHRLREQLIQWMPDGASLLLSAGEDLFLWQIGSVKWRQLTATEAAERDPKLSPDGA